MANPNVKITGLTEDVSDKDESPSHLQHFPQSLLMRLKKTGVADRRLLNEIERGDGL